MPNFIEININIRLGPRTTRQMAVDHQWSADHRLRTADIRVSGSERVKLMSLSHMLQCMPSYPMYNSFLLSRDQTLQLQECSRWDFPITKLLHHQKLWLTEVYSFIKSQVTYRTCLQSEYRLYEIRPTMQAIYTMGMGTTMQENQSAAQIATKHNIFP